MNKTIALSAILVSLSILVVGTMLMVSIPGADDDSVAKTGGLILIFCVPSFIVVLYKLIIHVCPEKDEIDIVKKNT